MKLRTLLLTSFLFIFSLNTQSEIITGEKNFGKITVKVFNNKKVHVFKDDIKMFGISCYDSPTCMVYTTNSNEPVYQYDAGELRLGGDKPDSIYNLSLDNIQEYQPRKNYDDTNISFIVITSGGSAGSQRGRYDIHTEHGWFSLEQTTFDWLRYGRKEDYP
ncbi:MAG TPA: hypothetical protein EYN08_04025 [Gammaproteobacteria bacterium]|nr:hypothetical protein [Gammaproteobacteria bacterium]